jgi:pseudaminic acid cytidylyltransferase
MRKVAIIIARGGSKRIPGKNIKPFRGKPIIAYSIQTAIQSNLFDYVMVSTDDDAIAKVALEYGAQVPFKRSAANSDDFAGTAEVILEVIEQLKT